MDFAATLINRVSEAFGNPYVVKEVPVSDYARLTAAQQDGKLQLYEGKSIDCVLLHPRDRNMFVRLFHLSKSQKTVARNAFTTLAAHLKSFEPNFPIWYTQNKLTALSEAIRQHPHWSSAHIAVQSSIPEALTREGMGSLVNSQQCDKMRSPMHLACDMGKLDMLEKCLQIGGDLSLRDDAGDTVVHYAVSKCSKQFVKFVCSQASTVILDIQNNLGETALHIACKERKADCCKMLLDAGASPNKCSHIGYPIHYALKYSGSDVLEPLLEKDPNQVVYRCAKHYALPIHWCKTGEDVDILVKYNSKVVAESSTGDMPLHVMVLKNRLDAAIGLLLNHADVNVKGKYDNTPLHLAIKNDNKMLVKMLLLYGADCQAQNSFKETPGLLAVRNSKTNKDAILELLSSVGGIHIGNGKTDASQPNSSVPSKVETSRKSRTVSILCLDGGGIRGLVLTQVLLAIEEETGKQARDLFDYICGTSTGGMLALSLALGIKAVDCQSIYFRLKDKVFSGPRPYDSKPMEDFLKNVFGEDTTLGDMQHPCKVIIPSVLADRRPAKLHLFRNYDPCHEFAPSRTQKQKGMKKTDSIAVQEMLASPMHAPLWQVARSSGAAPTYFRPMGSFVDGGVMANNPTLDVLTDIHLHNKALKKMNRVEDVREPGLVVSVGTGKVPLVKVKSVDVVRPTNPINFVNSALAGLELTQVMIDAACECDGHIVKRAEAWCDAIGVPFFRLNPQLKEDTALNEVNDEKLIDMMWATKLYIHENRHLIKEIAHLLLHS